MPRNPHKTPCQTPGCRSWAMRGYTHCRTHRDPELGPRGGGAPLANLNALKTGDHTHPLPAPDLQHLARQLVQQPGQLPYHLGLAAQSIHSRTQADPFRTLLALRASLSDLIPQVAIGLFTTEMDALLRRLPPSQRGPVLHTVRQQVGRQAPQAALFTLRSLMTEFEKSQKTSTGTTTPSGTAPSQTGPCGGPSRG
jgi:hypothetical protein